MSLFRKAVGAAAIALAATWAAPAAADEPPAPRAPESLMLPPLATGMTRVHGSVRPFFNLTGAGWGMISDVAVEHYFRNYWKLGVELSPLALVDVPEGLGAIAHARVRAALATDYLEVGFGVGGRFQHFGPSGWTVAPSIRLGSLDGLNLRMELASSLIRNYYTSRAELAFSHVLGGLDVPIVKRLAITVDGGFGLDLWAYVTLGLRHIVQGDGGPGTLALGASAGIVGIIDRFPCQYGDIEPCRGAAWGAGPTIALRVDRRF
jgi:hypothetical protein